MESQEADLLVIGGGVLGAFHAFHALQRGLRVTMLERNSEPLGATVRNFGQVVPSGMDPHWQQLGRRSLQIYQALQSEADLSIRQQGSIYIASDECELALLEELADINRQNDYRSELLSAKQCCERYPGLRTDYCKGGLFFPDELSLNPREMIHRLHRLLKANADYHCCFSAGVKELSEVGSEGVVAVTESDQRYYAKRAILCGGCDFRSLFPDVFLRSGLVTVQLQMTRLKPNTAQRLPGNILTGLTIRRYESFSFCPSWQSVQSQNDGEDFAKKWGIHILFKQEVDGGMILGDSHEYAKLGEEANLDFGLQQDITDFFIREGRKIFDLPHWEIDTSWMGRYSQTSDPSGIFKETIGDRIHIVTGIGGKGMTASPGFAENHLGEIFS